MNILIVDDNEDARIILAENLRAAGYKVKVAENGAEAMEKARHSAPDLIISDILMPVMDGFQLCMAVRENERLNRIPFVFYTATYTDEKDEVFALRIGADAFIRKPAESDDFLRRIGEVLSKPMPSKPRPAGDGMEDAFETLKLYNQRLINKLEKKANDLEMARVTERARLDDLEMLFNSSADGMLIIDNDFNVIRINDTYAKIFGVNHQDALGKKCHDFAYCPRCHTDDCSLKRIFDKQDRIEVEIERKRIDGSTIPCLLTVVPYRGRDGKVAGIVENYKDLSTIRLVETELKLVKSLIDQSNDAIFVADAGTGIFKYVNDRACTNLGYTSTELLRMKVMDIQDKFPNSASMALLIKEIKEKKRMIYENRHKRKDGTTFPVEISLKYTLVGERKFLMAVARDTTERKQAEAYHKRLVTAIDQAAESVEITDTQPKIEYVNPAFEKITGYSKDEVIGKNPRLLQSGTHGSSFYRVMWDTLTNGKVWRGRLQNKKKDSTLFYEDASISPVFDDDGKIINFVAVKRDVTQEIEMEEQLRQAQKMEAIGTLAGGVAHDFNNLLTTIIGNAQLALNDISKDDSLRKQIEEIVKAGQRSASLTRQLLAFSRKQIIQPRVLDLNEVLNGIEKMLGRLIAEDIELLLILEPALWQVEADPGQIEQVIMNLTVNARDAMPMGGKLTIETANANLDENYFRKHGIDGSPDSYVMLAIRDTGIGMNKETQEHIFEPFYTTKEIGKGTGLGLSTVYGIVKQNNGFIWIYSEPGQGSTFKIYLTKTKGDAEAKKKERTPEGDLNGSETVLIVEDDDSLRKLAQKALQMYGYKILEAENGEDALRVSEEYEGRIDLMVTDVVMPKMSGRETAERLQPLYPKMKVIYMSGYTDNAIAHHGILTPGLNFLEKPFSPEGLARKVREVLDQ